MPRRKAARAEPFRSALRARLQGRTEALEDLAVELFARGLSTRDIADSPMVTAGPCSAGPRSAS